MVEASLRPMIDRGLASVESHVKQMLPDIVKRCQEAIDQTCQAWRDSKTPPGSLSKTSSRSEEAQATGMTTHSEHVQSHDTMIVPASQVPHFSRTFSQPTFEGFVFLSHTSGCSCRCHDNRIDATGSNYHEHIPAHADFLAEDNGCDDCLGMHWNL